MRQMTAVRDIDAGELKLFGEIVARLERMDHEHDVRREVLLDIVRLVRADIAVSYIWNAPARRFDSVLVHNMDPGNLQRYEEWYQYHDPITFQLRAKRSAARVEEVLPYADLHKTEFYNDFLKRDGLHHGINLFLFDGDRDLGDFRLWRTAREPDFSERETTLLNILAPYLQRALVRNGDRFERLTSREKEVAFLVARGCRDRDIGKMLGIGFSTVRTHINSAMEKRGCANRAELAASIVKSAAGKDGLSKPD